MSGPEIRRLVPGDEPDIMAAAHLFDLDPRPEWTRAFLERDGHHLLVAYEHGAPAGFVSGIEVLHPDKGNEMLLYELGVAEPFRRQGIGRALVDALRTVAVERGCREMWVPMAANDDVAVATYRSAGGGPPQAAAITSWDLRGPAEES